MTVDEASELAHRSIELLRSLERSEQAFEELDPERELELVATGAIRQLNANRQWTLELAQAYATAALAAFAIAAWDER